MGYMNVNNLWIVWKSRWLYHTTHKTTAAAAKPHINKTHWIIFLIKMVHMFDNCRKNIKKFFKSPWQTPRDCAIILMLFMWCIKQHTWIRLFAPLRFDRRVKIRSSYADMAELADAHGSGPCESNFMEVQVLLSAPNSRNPNLVPIGNGFGFLIYLDYPNFNSKLK